MTRPTLRLLLATAAALAAFPAGARATPVCVGADVEIPQPILSSHTCVPTSLPGQLCRHPFFTGGSTGINVYGRVCVPTP